MDGLKLCFKCLRNLPLSEFYRHPKMADGHLNKCKECTRLDAARYAALNHEKVKERERTRNQRPERVYARALRQKLLRAKYPHKYKARNAVSNAIRDGKLDRKPCEVCGDPQSHAHHVDYSRPLDVVWLCINHHFYQHRKYDYEELKTKNNLELIPKLPGITEDQD